MQRYNNRTFFATQKEENFPVLDNFLLSENRKVFHFILYLLDFQAYFSLD